MSLKEQTRWYNKTILIKGYSLQWDFYGLKITNWIVLVLLTFPTDNYLIKFNSRNFRTMSEICSVFARKTPARHQCYHCSVFIVNFEQISYVVLMFVWKIWTGTCWLDKKLQLKGVLNMCSGNLAQSLK